jgi:hypothetical protein
MREAKDLSSNQLGGNSYLCNCAFAHLCGLCANKTTEKQQIQKTPSDGNRSTMIFCKFVYLCASQQNHSLILRQKHVDHDARQVIVWWKVFI